MNIHSTATKDCYGSSAAQSRKTILNCYEGDDLLQRILLSPFDWRPALHTEVASSDLEHVQGLLHQTLQMRLLPAFPVDDSTAIRRPRYIRARAFFNTAPVKTLICPRQRPALHWPSDRWTRCRSRDLVTATVDWPVTYRRGQGQAGHWHDEGLRMCGHVDHIGHAGAVWRSS